MDSPSLFDALNSEISRVDALHRDYLSIGDAGYLGAAMIAADLSRAKKARSEMDVAAMMSSYEALKGCE